MRSKRWRGALLGLVVTSLLVGALVSPSMAQGARASRGRHGYAPSYRRGYRGGGWGYYPRPYYAPRAGYYLGDSYYGGGLYGRPWGYSYSNGYLPGYGAFFGSSYYGSGYGYSQYRSSSNKHSLRKGFLQGWSASMFRTFLGELRHLAFDYAGVDSVAARLERSWAISSSSN